MRALLLVPSKREAGTRNCENSARILAGLCCLRREPRSFVLFCSDPESSISQWSSLFLHLSVPPSRPVCHESLPLQLFHSTPKIHLSPGTAVSRLSLCSSELSTESFRSLRCGAESSLPSRRTRRKFEEEETQVRPQPREIFKVSSAFTSLARPRHSAAVCSSGDD
eukprot:825270-Rhodomonas_salina.1